MTETKQIAFTIDGRAAEARHGETVLSVAKRMGIDIPALCHHPAVTAYGACRVCVVEVKKGKRARIVTACIYVPSDGDSVETGNARVKQLRRMILELLLARCPEVDLIRNLAGQYGVAAPPRFQVAASSRTGERCILCGLCVRVCAEAIGQHAIGYAQRGNKRTIATPFQMPANDCIGCGACVFVCPTRALHLEDVGGKRVMKELNTAMAMIKCAGCGRTFTTEKQIEQVRGRLPAAHDKILMCPSCRRIAFRDAVGHALT